MEVFKYEIKKSFYYRYGFLIIISFFISYSLIMILADTPTNVQTRYFDKEYKYYLEKVSGFPTTEKIEFLENEAKKISSTKVALQKLYDQYYDGKIDKISFEELSKEYIEILKNEKGFEEIYKQLVYVREDPNNRFFVDTNGWYSLLLNSNLDWLLFLSILILIIPIYCYEYSTKMNTILITTKNGQVGTNIKKICLAFSIVFLIGIGSIFVKTLLCFFKYGLDNGSYPLQSLEYFMASTKSISLFGAYMEFSLLKLFGCVFLSLIIMCICSIVKKTNLAIFICTGIIFLPYIGISENIKSRLPIPTTFIINSFLFKGTTAEFDKITNESIVVFKEVSKQEFFLLISGALILCFICIYTIIKINNNKLADSRKARIMPILLIIFILSGCGSELNSTTVKYNNKSRLSQENDQYRFYINNNKPMFVDKQTDVVEDLSRTPLSKNLQFANALFLQGDFVYYAYYTIDKSNIRYSNKSKITFIKVNLKTFEETIFFEKDLMKKDNLTSVDSNKWDFLIGVSSFFVQQDILYIEGGYENLLYKVNTKTGRVGILDMPTNGNIAFDGRYLYYISKELILSQYDTETNCYSDINEVAASNFYLLENSIIFANRKDKNRLYEMDIHGKNQRLIYDKIDTYFRYEDNCIKVTDKMGNEETLKVN